MNALNEYFSALERIKDNNPIRIQKGSRINKDTVALEAGRTRGSIKKSRKIFTELIYEIEKAAQSQMQPNTLKHKLEKSHNEKQHYRNLYHQALNRELMLLEQIAKLEKKMKK